MTTMHDENASSTLSLWHTLMRTGAVMRNAMRPVFADHGLTGPQWRVLGLLAGAGPQGLTPGQLTAGMSVTHGNTTGLVDKLVETGAVERQPHPDDRRTLLIRLTDRGWELHRAIIPAFEARVEETLGCLSEHQRSRLAAWLTRLTAHAEALGGGIPPEGGCEGPLPEPPVGR